ncbi:MAG TPA: response regulator [Polyangiaceae bacterium LLY-WYZ-15_(1-7)]|nr:hypothetical protein [Myxococcales bacterium]MAT28859.1 hypothetical protein [Sandaracinus sp.]HJK93645.1 response regulator [Polyangiaceae bacterium LLY-WYZ-15_(1-7)]MBJ74088.1 hypothetical protein [Sandaracinus sp.]HJL02958.1 response regulator [Polyangiaceae bacterium LLY-WYZ-15_(1-7)]
MTSAPILLVEDDVHVRGALARVMRRRGAEIVTAGSAREALEVLAEMRVQAIVADHHMPPGPTGVWLLEQVMHQHPEVRRLLFSGVDVPHADELVRIGLVHTLLRKPVTGKEILAAIDGPGQAPAAER